MKPSYEDLVAALDRAHMLIEDLMLDVVVVSRGARQALNDIASLVARAKEKVIA